MKANVASRYGLALLFAVAVLSPAAAQYGKAPDPADPRASAPAGKIESAFPGYQPFREQPIRPWKESNQEVADNPGMGAMGGMAGHSMPGMDSKGSAAGHDMSSMPGMPGMNSKPGAPPKANSGGKAGHDMGSMQGMPGMDTKSGGAPKAKTGGMASHDMGSMQSMPGMASKPGAATKPHGPDGHDHKMGSKQGMPGMAAKADVAPKPHGADGHDHAMGSMQGMPGMKSSASTAPKTGHDMGPMSNMPGLASKSDNASSGPVTGTGVVKGVDKPNGRIRLTHEPIEVKGWPRMTLFFRLKDRALADRVKEGDNVDFSLEKSVHGYVISDLRRSAASREPKPAK